MRSVCRKIYLPTLSSATVVIAYIQFSISEPANSIVLREDVLSDITALNITMKSRYDFNHCRIVPCTYAHNALRCSSVSHETWGLLRLAPIKSIIIIN